MELLDSTLNQLHLEDKSSTPHVALMEFIRSDPRKYFNYMRMDERQYKKLFRLVSPYLEKYEDLSRDRQLITVLRYLATGVSVIQLSYISLIEYDRLRNLIPKICMAIILGLEKYIKLPTTVEEWGRVQNGFSSKKLFPNCIGLIDTSDIFIVSSRKQKMYYQKSFFRKKQCIKLLTLCDSDHNFLYVLSGAPGHITDNEFYQKSLISIGIDNGNLNIPVIRSARCKKGIPCVFLADNKF